jgi:hypothetical protein
MQKICRLKFSHAIKLKFQGEDILIGLVNNPPGVPRLPVYQPFWKICFLSWHWRFKHKFTSQLGECAGVEAGFGEWTLSIIFKVPTNFSSASPTLIDVICATSKPDSIEMFLQNTWPTHLPILKLGTIAIAIELIWNSLYVIFAT